MVVKLKKAALGIVSVGVGVGLMVFSEGVRSGVSSSIELCISTVIPSLFLFTALAVFLVKSGLTAAVGRLLDPVSRLVFGLSGEQFAVMLASFVSGYPVGARLVNELFSCGRATEREALRMLDFCVCGGPAFIVLAVGEATLGSRSDGFRLLIAHLLSAVFLAVVSRFFSRSSPRRTDGLSPAPCPPPISEAFTRSVTDAARSMFGVSAFVVAFGGLGGFLSSLEILPPAAVKTARALLEVTVGVGLFGRKQLELIAFLLGFGGISVHFQVLSSAAKLKVPYYRLFLSRTLHGALSAGLIMLMELVSPRVIDTVAGTSHPSPGIHGSPAAVIALLTMGAVLIGYSSGVGAKKRMEIGEKM